jgi:hypothetical protein
MAAMHLYVTYEHGSRPDGNFANALALVRRLGPGQ